MVVIVYCVNSLLSCIGRYPYTETNNCHKLPCEMWSKLVLNTIFLTEKSEVDPSSFVLIMGKFFSLHECITRKSTLLPLSFFIFCFRLVHEF